MANQNLEAASDMASYRLKMKAIHMRSATSCVVSYSRLLVLVVAITLTLARNDHGPSSAMLPIAAAFQPALAPGSQLDSILIRNQRLYANGRGNDETNSSIQTGDSTGTQEDMNIVTKSSWYAVEWFGKAFGTSKDETGESATSDAPKSLQETLLRIQEDNDRSYFLSGEMDVAIYDPDCVFADPFVSFSGRDRFVDNLQNLGSFITKYDARVLPNKGSDAAKNDNVVKTRLMVKLELNLPWKPVLAWPWGVTYTIDPDSFLITEHVESWEIEPLEGVKQIFRSPTVKL
eukprot:CAMPEP_0172364968 /NCGR_PEP_ID=MMETSP1060-20121228/7982_1 /TAXON_ID=37318 /ORGANISM="Pseudo-nitzschia pungens, Strain cf. cingulata" /LENGTH=288 /DNA_ID=CAMNT_0013088109 /DNA_START=64 /DNA_END=930 /DNA_ORIENTATION=+